VTFINKELNQKWRKELELPGRLGGNPVRAIAISPSGNLIVVGGDGRAIVMDGDGNVMRELPYGANNIEISDDGSIVLLAPWHFVNMKTGKVFETELNWDFVFNEYLRGKLNKNIIKIFQNNLSDAKKWGVNLKGTTIKGLGSISRYTLKAVIYKNEIYSLFKIDISTSEYKMTKLLLVVKNIDNRVEFITEISELPDKISNMKITSQYIILTTADGQEIKYENPVK